MRKIHPTRLLGIAAALGLVATSSISDASTFGGLVYTTSSNPIRIYTSLCPTPTDTQCADGTFMSSTPTAGSCAATQQAQCVTILQSKFYPTYSSIGAPKPEFAVNSPQDPANLRSGRCEPFDGSKVSLISYADPTYAGTNLYIKSIMANQAYKAWAPYLRSGAGFQNDGDKLTSCKEYAFKRYWDYQQFSDDSDQCMGDVRCTYDAAFNGPNAIANKTLHQRNGYTPLDHQIALTVDRLPKNVFFEFGTSFLAHTGDPVVDAKLDAIGVLMKRGAQYYGVGQPGTGETFPDEWAYHKALHDRTASVSDAEFLEYANRQANAQQVLQNWIAFLIASSAAPETKPGDLGAFVDPGSIFQPDPIDWSEGFRAQLAVLVSRGALDPASVLTQTSGLNNVAGVSWLSSGGMLSGTQTISNGISGTTSFGNIGLVNNLGSLTGNLATIGTITTATPTLNTYSYSYAGYALYKQARQVLLDEYDRYARGAGGCFDPSNFACDWSPTAFASRIRGLYKSDVEAAFSDCMTLASDFSVVPTAASVDYPGDATSDVPAFDAWIKAYRARLQQQFAAVPRYPGGPLGKTGTNVTSSNTLGSTDTFQASYDYQVGWSAQKAVDAETAYKGTPDQAAAFGDKRTCALKGEVHANFHADAKIFGKDLLPIIDAILPSDVPPPKHIVSSETSAAVNGAGIASLDSETTITGYQIYSPIHETAPASHTWDVALAEGKIDTTPLSATFVVVVVPVTVAAYASLHYGANLVAVVGATNACTGAYASLPKTPAPTFGVNANLTPYANIDVLPSLAVGVPGFDVGVKGDVTLVRVAAPITGGINVQTKDSASSGLAMVFNTNGHLKLSELNGSVSAFADFTFWSYEKQLFSWDGYSQDVKLWDTTASIDLPAFNTVDIAP